jgi:hypothetical protein
VPNLGGIHGRNKQATRNSFRISQICHRNSVAKLVIPLYLSLRCHEYSLTHISEGHFVSVPVSTCAHGLCPLCHATRKPYSWVSRRIHVTNQPHAAAAAAAVSSSAAFKVKKTMAVAERELHVQCAAVRVVRLEEE